MSYSKRKIVPCQQKGRETDGLTDNKR